MKKVSFVIPCYQDAPHLEKNVDRILKMLGLLNLSFEMIFVDDRSPDDTAQVIQKILKKYPAHDLKALFHTKNLGRGGAFMAGARASVGDVVGFFDIDLEVSPVYLFECIHKILDQNNDLVIGQRTYKVSPALFYRHILSTSYATLVSKLLNIPPNMDTESGYKFFNRKALLDVMQTMTHTGWFWDTEVVCRFYWENKKIALVPCLFIRNAEKKSTVKPLLDSFDYLKKLLAFRKTYKASLQKNNDLKTAPIVNKEKNDKKAA